MITRSPKASTPRRKTPSQTPRKRTRSTPGLNLADFIVARLDDGKAEDIVRLDVRPLSSLTDTLIIATGTSTRHTMSLAYNLIQALKKKRITPLNDATVGTGDWVVVDLGDTMVHLFTPTARDLYALEKMWTAQK